MQLKNMHRLSPFTVPGNKWMTRISLYLAYQESHNNWPLHGCGKKSILLKIFGNISSMTDDIERVSEVHAVKNFNLHFANSETTDSRHLEN